MLSQARKSKLEDRRWEMNEMEADNANPELDLALSPEFSEQGTNSGITVPLGGGKIAQSNHPTIQPEMTNLPQRLITTIRTNLSSPAHLGKDILFFDGPDFLS